MYLKLKHGLVPVANPNHLVKNKYLTSKNDSQETSVAHITRRNPRTKKKAEACHAGIIDGPYEHIVSNVPFIH